MRPRFVGAVVQAAPVAFRLEPTLAKVETLAAEAVAQGAALVVFPEAFVGGYPKGADFGARVGSRSDVGREEFRRYFESAIELPSRASERLGEIAAKLAIHLVIGVVERAGSTLYCTVVFYDATGRYLGKHRKLMPTASERLIWGFGDGSTLPVFDTAVGRIGAVICWENYMPLLRTAMYAQGIDVYCAPTVDARATWTPTMQHVALEGRCFVLSSNQFARRADYPEDYRCEPSEAGDVLIGGGSAIVSPLGELLAGPLRGSEGILTAELDLGRVAEARFDFDAVGHYARPDVFSLHVNRDEQRGVSFSREPGQAGEDGKASG